MFPMRKYVLNTMRDIIEITRADEEELLARAKQRIGNLPILKEIYDENFLSKVVRRKKGYDNLLLFWFVTDNPVAISWFQEIEENLKILQPENAQKFEEKLRQWDTKSLESAIAEIEFVAEYKRQGFQIEIEPTLPNGKKGEFCVSKDSLKIFFEVKNIFPQRNHEDELIINELEDRYSRLDTPFVIGFDLKKRFQRSKTFEVVKHIKEKLEYLERTDSRLPQSFVYPESSEPIIEIDIIKRLPKGEKGFISGGVFGGGLKGNWNDLRSKISSGISQLHPDYPGVIVVQPHGLVIGQYDIENALLGDLKVNLLGEPKAFRGKDRIFAKDKNKRLSAVIYCEKRLQGSGYTKKKLVYHNLNPKTKLSPKIFKGENVTQYIPIKLDNGKVCYKQINTREQAPRVRQVSL